MTQTNNAVTTNSWRVVVETQLNRISRDKKPALY